MKWNNLMIVWFLVDASSGIQPNTITLNEFETNSVTDRTEAALQELLSTTQSYETATFTVLPETTTARTKTNTIRKRDTTTGILTTLRDSTTLSDTQSTNTRELTTESSVTRSVKNSTIPLSAPKSLPYASTNNKQPISSTVSSLAFTNGKSGVTEIIGRDPCYVRDSLTCVDELKCAGSGEIDCSRSQQDYKDEYYYDDEKASSTISPINTPELSNDTYKAYLNFNRRRKKIGQTTKAGGRNPNVLPGDDEEPDTKPCSITGDVQCLPVPTYGTCRGKSLCGDPQKSETSGGLKDWEIAVISVLTILGIVLLSALIYVIYTSWKKKKVRPTAAVTNVHHIMGRRVRS